MSLIPKFRRDSVISDARLAFLEYAARCVTAEQVPGELVEIGVYHGGSARILADRCPGRVLHLFDTFTGIPGETIAEGLDLHAPGDFADVDLSAVRVLLADAPAIFHVGLFPDTLSELAGESQFALVHVDCDTHAAILAALEYFHPRLAPGGFLIVDDYGAERCPGAKIAVETYFAADLSRLRVTEPANGYGVWTRRPWA